jgi:hypothetical protein
MNTQGRLKPALEVAREGANAAMGGLNADARRSGERQIIRFFTEHHIFTSSRWPTLAFFNRRSLKRAAICGSLVALKVVLLCFLAHDLNQLIATTTFELVG